MKTLIVVPARYKSKRFPGKPLQEINGISMLRRTSRIAQKVAETSEACDYVVATDDERIQSHCFEHEISCVMTAQDLKSGSDRALSACITSEKANKNSYTHIINLQGDAPFTPAEHVKSVHKALCEGVDVATPFIQLTWEELDELRAHKQLTPFSGTTLIRNENNVAIWFSKNIIPAIRKEKYLRENTLKSPICRHIGLYGYKRTALETFVSASESRYEALESLEQLRFLENGIPIQCVQVQPARLSMSGIDTAEDLKQAERLIDKYGDPYT